MLGIMEAPIAGMSGGRSVAANYASANYYDYVIDFDGAAVAAGTNQEGSVRIQNDADFLIRQVVISARLDGVVTNSIAGTPLAWVGEPNSDRNELPTMELVRVWFKDNDSPWSNVPVPATAFGQEGWLATMPVLGSNSTLFATVYNDAAIDLDFRITFRGAKLRGRKA